METDFDKDLVLAEYTILLTPIPIMLVSIVLMLSEMGSMFVSRPIFVVYAGNDNPITSSMHGVSSLR